MDEKELFRELKDNGHRFVWYHHEPGISNPDGNSPDLQLIVDPDGKELARRLDIPEVSEHGWRIDTWRARDFGGLPVGAVEIDLHLVLTRFLLGATGPCFQSP